MDYTEDLERKLWQNAGSETGRQALQSFYEFVSKIEAKQNKTPESKLIDMSSKGK